jgi:pectinesterase
VHFGTDQTPPFRREQAGTTFETGRLKLNQTYYWRVDTVTSSGIVPGTVWAFTTKAASGPLETSPSANQPARPASDTTAVRMDASNRGPRPRVRIVLVGDSTVTDEVGWGRGFKARLAEGVECVNLARNGRSSKSYLAEGLWAAALKEGADYILIQFGHNDMPGKGPDRETDPKTTYRDNLSRYVDEARGAGALPVIVTSLTRRHFGPDGRIVSDLGDYVEVARQVANNKNIPLVDLHAASIALLNRMGPMAAAAFDAVQPDGTPDLTHLSPRGSAVFGALVAQQLRAAVLALADRINP